MLVEVLLSQDVDLYTFEGPITSIITTLQNIQENHSLEGFTELRIEINKYYDDIDIYLYGKREETEEEIARREGRVNSAKLAAQKRKENREKNREKVKLKAEQEEKELYEKLKLKYDNSN